jgi:hypothetical protein
VWDTTSLAPTTKTALRKPERRSLNLPLLPNRLVGMGFSGAA